MMPPFDKSPDPFLLPHRIFIADSLRHSSSEILFWLLQKVPSNHPTSLMWSAQPIWSAEDFLSMAAWVESQSSPDPITVITCWEAWTNPRQTTTMRALESFALSVRWIWSVDRSHWATARPFFVHLCRVRWPDADELNPQFTGWLESPSSTHG